MKKLGFLLITVAFLGGSLVSVVHATEVKWRYFGIAFAIGVIGVFLSNYLYKKNINSLKDKSSLREKLTGFQSASIISYAPLEGAALLGIVAAYKYPNIFYLIISALLIIYLFYRRPSKDKIERDLELNSELKNQFNKSEETID